MMLGIFRSLSNCVTMGIEPPERMYTVSLPKTSCIATTEARAYGLSVLTTQAGPLLCTFMLVVIPFGVTSLTYFVNFFRMSSASWLGTSRIETLADPLDGITVFAPGATNPPIIPWTSRVGRAQVRCRTEYPGSPVSTSDPTSALRYSSSLNGRLAQAL